MPLNLDPTTVARLNEIIVGAIGWLAGWLSKHAVIKNRKREPARNR